MMYDDPIVNEIRRIRKEHAEKFGGDLHAICEDLRRLERESGRKYVSFPPRPALDRKAGPARKSPPGEGLRRAFGAWAENAAELDEYLRWNQQQREFNRPEGEP